MIEAGPTLRLDGRWVPREMAIWEEYGFTGHIEPENLLKECQRRLRAAAPGSDLQLKLKSDLETLDKLHQYRKSLRKINALTLGNAAFAFGRQHSAGVWKDAQAVTPTERMRSKGSHFWALIMGNDGYLGSPLSGCINDAKLVHDYLLNDLHVPSGHIRVLSNASRDAMINALYDLRDDKHIRHGDNILIHYSGHGSSYRAANFFESDAARAGSIEAICPIDRSDEVPDISDRELNSILSGIHAAKGPNIILILDCCYSGGSLREELESLNDGTTRYAPPLTTKDGIRKMFKAADSHPRRHARMLTSSEDWEEEDFPIVLLAACQDFQLAKESNFDAGRGDSSTSRMHLGGGTVTNSSTRYGHFTYALIKILKSDRARNTTYEKVIELVGRLGDMQIPVAIGQTSRRLWFEEPEVRNRTPSPCTI